MNPTSYLKRRSHTWYFHMRIPSDLVEHYGKTELLFSLRTKDLAVAQRLRWREKERLEAKFDLLRAKPNSDPREIYEAQRKWLESTDGLTEEQLEVTLYDLEDKVVACDPAQADPETPLPEDIQARVDAIHDVGLMLVGKSPVRAKHYEPPVEQIAQQWLKDKESTGARIEPHQSILRMFSSFMGNRSVRKVTPELASQFVDRLRYLKPTYKSDPRVKSYSFDELVKKHSGDANGLSVSTVNTQINRLAAFWDWSKSRGLCKGDNPFKPLVIRVSRSAKGRKDNAHKVWKNSELIEIISSDKLRDDLREVCIVALHSGMRINEICSLTWADLQLDNTASIWFFNISDAKTESGNRKVPLHTRLWWLTKRGGGNPEEKIWPRFNPEGPYKKPGEDASKMFGAFKKKLGITEKGKTFHSFRKNFTTQLENAGVYYSAIQDILGHRRDNLALDVYSSGLYLEKKHEYINRVDFDFIPAVLQMQG
ncbi:DUF6538 domain-containing protein [Kordiimonas sp.]|uniref:DUF6538 domain-containing protein n=1 Tax=Kordiimonas sp. TaxID=1970157 RepID=UPI003A919F60